MQIFRVFEESDVGMHAQENKKKKNKTQLRETIRWRIVLEKNLMLGTRNLCHRIHLMMLSSAVAHLPSFTAASTSRDV